MSDYSRTLRLAAPVVAENLLNSMVLLVDALMVAQVGNSSLAAAGIAGVVLWRLRSLSGVLATGVGAVTARRWGEMNDHAASVTMTHGAVLGFFASLPGLLLILFAPWLFAFLNAEGEVGTKAVVYFQIIAAAMPLRMVSWNLSASMRAAGDTRTPMVVTLIINLVNAGFNYVLIFGKFGFPALGLTGAAVATFIAFVAELAMLGWASARGLRPPHHGAVAGQRGLLRFHDDGWQLWIRGLSGKILRIAWPTFWEEVAVSIGFLVFIAMIAGLGPDALAAHTSVARIESFSFLFGVGMATAAATLVGQSLGARDPVRARRFFTVNIVVAVIAMGALATSFVLFSHVFLGLFAAGSAGQALLAVGTPILIIAAIEQPLIGTAMVLGGGLRGAGMTTAPLISQLFGTIAVRIGVGYWLAFPMGMGLEGIYWGTVADWGMRVLILGWITARGRWEKLSV